MGYVFFEVLKKFQVIEFIYIHISNPYIHFNKEISSKYFEKGNLIYKYNSEKESLYIFYLI